MRLLYITILLSTISILTACHEINTTNPEKAYKYWIGEKPDKDIEVLNGQYWKSPHWSYEYKVFLKFKASEEWWNVFSEKSLLKESITRWSIPSDFPKWFSPPSHSKTYELGKVEFGQGALYYRDSIASICYVYEIQL